MLIMMGKIQNDNFTLFFFYFLFLSFFLYLFISIILFFVHITPFGEKNFHLNTLLAISMAECLVANRNFVLYCIVYISFCYILLKWTYELC